MTQIRSAIFDRSPVEPQPSRGKNNYPTLHLPQTGESDPSDRQAQLSTLLERIQENGAQSHEQEIDQPRAIDDMSETEREIVLEIFRFGYEAAERERRQDKMWAYQRLLRRLMRHQPLDQPIPLTTPSGETPWVMTAQVEWPTIEKKARSQENKPNRLRKRALRRQLIKYRVFLGGAAALLWVVYANRSLIGGWHPYTLPNTITQNFVPASAEMQKQIHSAIPTAELANAANFAPSSERAAATRPEPAMNQGPSVESGAAVTGNAAAANAEATARSAKLSASAAEAQEGPRLDVSSGSVNSSLRIYRTVRRILLREEPRFGAASQIMLDLGARLIILDINGRWLKVKMEKTGSIGFVREEFVAPTSAGWPSSASKEKNPS